MTTPSPAVEAPRARRASSALEAACDWASTRSPSEIVSARVPSSALADDLRIDPANADALFVSGRGAAFSGFGSAAEISASGEDRFADVARAGARLLGGIARHGGAEPRLIGGFAFEDDAPGDPWSAFGAASFRLPRFLVERDERGVEHVTISAEACVFAHPDALVDELRGRVAPAPLEAAARPTLEAARAGTDRYESLVARALRAIASGALEKVVLARRDRVSTRAGRSPAGAVRALLARADASSAVFALRQGERTFLGATPERLVAIRGDRISAEAVAGSRPRRGDDRAELALLLASDKDAREHEVVRHAIAEALSRIAGGVRIGARTTRTLGFVHHLVTPIEAPRGSTHVVELAGALHPTPAMAGAPTSAARAYIRSEEGFARGWYASPFGWFDANGQGEFVVGIRSALLDPDGAWVFAGAGIVRGSEPALEAAETRAKQA
ncbi:MAG: isochorismate synthase, partial [Polyangiaceae bacterium]